MILDYAHLRGIVLNNIKADNILINNICAEKHEIEVLISDLSSVKLLSSSNEKIVSGPLRESPRFMEPEVEKREEITPQLDIIQAGSLF